MKPHDHDTYAERIERTLGKLGADDHELLIEGAMLARLRSMRSA